MARRRYRSRWNRYVPMAERRMDAEREVERLREEGQEINPIVVEGRKIAHTFWGEAWCTHLEQFSDYANRLPRGKRYARNGSVIHLEVARGEVNALVSGSAIYRVHVPITLLSNKRWADLKKRCAGQVGSLLDLLEGRLSDGVMAVVTDPKNGLFPQVREIKLGCSCPDWATMCKHVAAVLYGVGARLDQQPELLFRLRGVDHEELIAAETGEAVAALAAAGSGRRLPAEALQDVFGIELAQTPPAPASQRGSGRKKKTGKKSPAKESPAKKKARKKTAKKVTPAPRKRAARSNGPSRSQASKSSRGRIEVEVTLERVPARKTPTRRTPARKTPARKAPARRTPAGKAHPTGGQVAKLREHFGMNRSQFALLVGVSPTTVSNWEKKAGRLNLQAATLEAWRATAELTSPVAWRRLGAMESGR